MIINSRRLPRIAGITLLITIMRWQMPKPAPLLHSGFCKDSMNQLLANLAVGS